MSYYVQCDWCGRRLYHDDDQAILEVKIERNTGTRLERRWAAEVRPTRHFCVEQKVDRNRMGLPDDDRPGGCYEKAIAAITGTKLSPPDMGLEWRLVPVDAPATLPTSAQPSHTPPDAELSAVLAQLPPKCRYTLPRAGVSTLDQVAAMTDGQLLALSGVGQHTIDVLRAAIEERKVS